MADGGLVNPDLGFIREIRKAGGNTVNKCFQCATCSVVCNLSPADKPFPRKEMLDAQWGRVDRLTADPDIWLCYQCNDCSTHCPRGARPGDVMAAVRAYVYKKFAVPSFMGTALANPMFLPLLLLVPILILIACINLTAPRDAFGEFLFTQPGVIDFNLFLPHSTVDALFVLGNILIFSVAAIGFRRFWNSLQARGDVRQTTFLKALMPTIMEVITHSRFSKCEANKPRSTAHILVLAGFVGAMITTGIVFVFIFIPHYLSLLGLEQFHSFFDLPLELPHPVKFLGAASGLMLFLGSGIMIFRRWGEKDEVGASGYADNLFLYIIFLTGLTGMTSWLLRTTGAAPLAYLSYFFHIVFVYFLLWYMPYSKFAHMIYRTLALTYAGMIGRKERSQ